MVEIKIVKKTIVTVADKEFNEYGDIIFHDREGNKYKIGVKRAHLDEKLVIGQAVELGWGRFKDATKNIEYIADVKLVSEEMPTPTERGASLDDTEITPLPQPAKAISGVEIGRCWNAIDALYIGGKLNTLFGKENAEAILKYYRGVLTSTLKLPTDDAKLPMWDKKSD